MQWPKKKPATDTLGPAAGVTASKVQRALFLSSADDTPPNQPPAPTEVTAIEAGRLPVHEPFVEDELWESMAAKSIGSLSGPVSMSATYDEDYDAKPEPMARNKVRPDRRQSARCLRAL